MAKVKGLRSLEAGALELTWHHILLVKARLKISPVSKTGQVDLTSCEQEVQNIIHAFLTTQAWIYMTL